MVNLRKDVQIQRWLESGDSSMEQPVQVYVIVYKHKMLAYIQYTFESDLKSVGDLLLS